MKRLFLPVVVLSAMLLFTGCSVPFLGSQKMAALNVTATPKAGIFLNDKHVSATPYFDTKVKPGEYTLKLVPESGIGQPWEARVTLAPGIMTVVSRELGETQDQSGGYILSLEPETAKDKTSLLVVSSPDGSVVSLDGEPKGFAPVAIDNVTPGDHVLLVSSPGYIERSINANVIAGYKLTASVQLAKSTLAQAEPTPTPEAEETDDEDTEEVLDENLDEETTPTPKATPKTTAKPTPTKKPATDLEPPYVTILDTPTGWLNVRETPSTADDNVLAKVNPGDTYRFIESNTSGWYKIELENGDEGWIAAKYAKLTKS